MSKPRSIDHEPETHKAAYIDFRWSPLRDEVQDPTEDDLERIERAIEWTSRVLESPRLRQAARARFERQRDTLDAKYSAIASVIRPVLAGSPYGGRQALIEGSAWPRCRYYDAGCRTRLAPSRAYASSGRLCRACDLEARGLLRRLWDGALACRGCDSPLPPGPLGDAAGLCPGCIEKGRPAIYPERIPPAITTTEEVPQ